MKKTLILTLLLLLALILTSCASGPAAQPESTTEPVLTTEPELEPVSTTEPELLIETIVEVTASPQEAINARYAHLKKPQVAPRTDASLFEEDGRYGLKINGETVLDAIWQAVVQHPYDDTLFFVQLNDMTGIATDDGRLLLEPVYNRLEVADAGDAYVYIAEKDGLTGILNSSLQEIVKPVWESFYVSWKDPGYALAETQDGVHEIYAFSSGKTLYATKSSMTQYDYRVINDRFLVIRTFESYGSSTKRAYVRCYGTDDIPFGGESWMRVSFEFIRIDTREAIWTCRVNQPADTRFDSDPPYFAIEPLGSGLVVSDIVIDDAAYDYDSGLMAKRYAILAEKTFVDETGGSIVSDAHYVWNWDGAGAKNAAQHIVRTFDGIQFQVLEEEQLLLETTGDGDESDCHLFDLNSCGKKVNLTPISRKYLDGITEKDGKRYLLYPHYKTTGEDGTVYEKGWFVINLSTRETVNLVFTTISEFSEGLAAVQDAETKKWGYIDVTGTLVIDCQFDDATPFSNGQASVVKDYRKQIIDQTGTVQ